MLVKRLVLLITLIFCLHLKAELINCPDCKNKVSTLAKACPKCGRPIDQAAITKSKQDALKDAEIKKAVAEELQRIEQEKKRKETERQAKLNKEKALRSSISWLKWATKRRETNQDYFTIDRSFIFKKKYEHVYYKSINKIHLNYKSEMFLDKSSRIQTTRHKIKITLDIHYGEGKTACIYFSLHQDNVPDNTFNNFGRVAKSLQYLCSLKGNTVPITCSSNGKKNDFSTWTRL
jgi:hypothetical protein